MEKQKLVVHTGNPPPPNAIEYFGGLPKIDAKDWPHLNDIPAIHLLSLAFAKNETDLGLAIFFHSNPADSAYIALPFRNTTHTIAPADAIVMPLGSIERVDCKEGYSLSFSSINGAPQMRYGDYSLPHFFAQLTNDILPFPSEEASLYIDHNASLFLQT